MLLSLQTHDKSDMFDGRKPNWEGVLAGVGIDQGRQAEEAHQVGLGSMNTRISLHRVPTYRQQEVTKHARVYSPERHRGFDTPSLIRSTGGEANRFAGCQCQSGFQLSAKLLLSLYLLGCHRQSLL